MKEKDIQNAIMNAIMFKVVWAMITTTGTVKGVHGGRPFAVGSVEANDLNHKTGLSDIIGQLKGGKFFAIEVKLPGKEPTEQQYNFINMVNDNNGVAGWCDSVDGAMEILND